MDFNELNRRLRYGLMLDDQQVLDLYALASYEVESKDVAAWRLKDNESGFLPCPALAVQRMLDGLIIQRRGVRQEAAGVASAGNARVPGDNKLSAETDTLDNNLVLKLVKIALQLKTDDVLLLIKEGGGSISKGEVSAFFRSPSARNYRRCGDQALRWFLAGLAARRQTPSASGKHEASG